jgi:hypothetical protein
LNSIEESADVALLSIMGATSTNEVVRRLANDHVAFIAFLDGIPAAFGWMARGKAFIGELNHSIVLPFGQRYLWNFRTMEKFRGLGIYPALVQYMISAEAKYSDRFWIIHAPENEPSLRGIQKAGFQYVGRLYSTNGNTVIQSTQVAIENKAHLKEMDIDITTEQPVSCWNCTSPYLKNRRIECCCAAVGTICVGHNLSSLLKPE